MLSPSPSPTTLQVSSDSQPSAPSLGFPQAPASEHASPTPTQVVQHLPAADSQAAQPASSLSTETSNDSWSNASYSTASNSQSSAAQMLDQKKDARLEQLPTVSSAAFVQSDQPLMSNALPALSPAHAVPSTQAETEVTQPSFSHAASMDSGSVVEPPTSSQDNIPSSDVTGLEPKLDSVPDVTEHTMVSPTHVPTEDPTARGDKVIAN